MGDILLYQAGLVPVGEDQRQHLELTRDIARRFHDLYCKRKKRVFREPKALIVKEGARVMSLTDGRAKMSKSAELDNSRINLNDDPATIARKIKKCKSDEFTGLEWDNPERPEATNLLNIYQAVTGMERDAILAEVGDLSWGGFKPRLADAVVAPGTDPAQVRGSVCGQGVPEWRAEEWCGARGRDRYSNFRRGQGGDGVRAAVLILNTRR